MKRISNFWRKLEPSEKKLFKLLAVLFIMCPGLIGLIIAAVIGRILINCICSLYNRR